MSVIAAITGAMLLQSAFPLGIDSDPQPQTTDVAYSELKAGASEAALRKLEDSPGVKEGDPATLINLGTAYTRVGMTDRAMAAYRAAIASDMRYDLELADGSWMDSRVAAQTALDRLLRARARASRD